MSCTVNEHDHTTPRDLAPAMPIQHFAAVVGTVEKSTEHDIVGRNGEHLQFYVDVQPGVRYQVDVNIQSRDSSQILMYVASESLQAGGPPAFGVFADAKLSYAGMGLTDGEFQALSAVRIQALLEAALNQGIAVGVYGQVFDDGGPDGKGIHETHYNRGRTNEDGALAVYGNDAQGKPQRTWFFFKFSDDSIGAAATARSGL